MQTTLTQKKLIDITCDMLILGAGHSPKAPSSLLAEIDQLMGGHISTIYANGEFKGNSGEICQIYTLDKMTVRRILLVGVGEHATDNTFRRASSIGIRYAQRQAAREIVLAFDLDEDKDRASKTLQAVVEGALLGSYSFTRYQTTPRQAPPESIQFLNPNPDQSSLEEALQRGIIMAEAANFARDLVNEQSSVLTPGALAAKAGTMAERFSLECQIIDQNQMQELGMGGLLAVAKGSSEPPTFIILRHRGLPESTDKDIALVGKGITFDSGGLSIKTADGMASMKGDMGGAAAVLGAMYIIGALKPSINVTALIPGSENMTDGSSYRPGDILRLMNGKTIEIVNTDAEGRLALADALSYASQEGYSPIIDIATLTGGCYIALGGVRAGLFCNDHTLSDELMESGEITDEKFWPMPVDDDYLEKFSSQIADMKQTGGRYGGASIAAKILEQFVGKASWGHLDIAGMEFFEGNPAFAETGASGFGARALATFVLKRAEANKPSE